MPAAVKLMAEAMFGAEDPQATKKLFAMMERGELDPNKALPKFFAILERKAQLGMPGYIKTSRMQQNLTAKTFEDRLLDFTEQGGEEAFTRIWKSFNETLSNAQGTTKLLATSFNGLSIMVESVGHSFTGINALFEASNKSFPIFNDLLIGGAAGLFLLKTTVGRLLLPVVALTIAIDEITSLWTGKKSLLNQYVMGKEYDANNRWTGGRKTLFENEAGLGAVDRINYNFENFSKFSLSGKFAAAGNMLLDAPIGALEAFGTSLGNIMVNPMNPGQIKGSDVKFSPMGIDALTRSMTGFSSQKEGNYYQIQTVNLYPNNNKPEEFSFLLQKQVPTAISE